MQEVLNKILIAKEQRRFLRVQIAEMGYATISINFNIPSYPKTDSLLSEAFTMVSKELKYYLIANRIAIKPNSEQVISDEVGDICFFFLLEEGLDLKALKEKLELFEESHFLGRILDVDLFDRTPKAISSHKQKSCFICKDKSALHCMRNQNHSPEELRKYIDNKVIEYVIGKQEDVICKKLSSSALGSILTEISLLDKPGLVSPDSNGSHTDMNYHTFLASSSAIGMHFYQVAQLGYRWDGKNKRDILVKLRILGLQMEEDMFNATKGVNTQKGIVFLMIYCLFVSAYILKAESYFNPKSFVKILSKLNKGLLNNELNKHTVVTEGSHGQECYQKYGILAGGIRKEVEEGIPTFFEDVYPYMKSISFTNRDVVNKSYFQSQCRLILLKIMSVNNDTNVLFRSNQKTLEKVKQLSLKAINKDKNKYCQKLVDFCQEKNISPGGSADLLAVSLFLFSLIETYNIDINSKKIRKLY